MRIVGMGRAFFSRIFGNGRPMSTRENTESAMPQRNRGVQILAKSIYRDLMAQGFAKRDIVNLATALLDQVTTKMAAEAPSRD